jgi:cysteinyl-tRNA synthetase
VTLAAVAAAWGLAAPCAAAAKPGEEMQLVPPRPQPAVRPSRPGAAVARTQRLSRNTSARSWGYQLNGLDIEAARRSPYDLLVVDATTGLAAGRPFRAAETERLKRKPDGSPRLVVSYLSIGEAEDYRPDYFTPEYMTEDAPDWLLHENPQWKGNRIIRFCTEGWQRTILGDEEGRNVYNGVEPSPLYRLIELGFDGVYLDRVDVYAEVAKHCNDAERRMVDFVARLAAHARKRNPHFIVILQNAEELLRHKRMVEAIDAIAKEDLFYGADHSERANGADAVRDSLAHLRLAKTAGRAVFVVDYLKDAGRKADAKRRIEAEGFVPYIGPRDLGKLWLPGVDF